MKNDLSKLRRWAIKDAKAQLSQVVKLAQSEGPQIIKVRGKDVAVVVRVEEVPQIVGTKATK